MSTMEMISDYDAKKQELNCGINIIPLITFYENLLGKERAKEVIESFGISMNFLTDRKNWISYEFYTKLLEKLVEITGDEKVPYKISFAMKPKSVFQEIYYASYATIFSGSPKHIFKLIFNKSIYSRYTKIGDFKILELANNFMIVELKLKEGYKQHRYNCLAIQGYMAAGTMGTNLPLGEVEHTHCACDGHESCIYKIRWKPRGRNRTLIASVFIAASVVIFQLIFMGKLFEPKDIALTASIYVSFIFFSRYARSLKTIRNNEIFNFEKKNTMLQAMKKIEKSYNEINYTKKILEEKTLFLGMINQIIGIITNATYFTPLLKSILKIITTSLNFSKTAFFQVDRDRKGYKPLFMFNNGYEVDRQLEEVKRMFVTNEEFSSMTNYGYEIDWTEWVEKFNFQSEEFTRYLEVADGGVVYYLPVIVEELYSGFFIFCSDKKLSYSNGVIFTLFDNIKNQLKMGFLKITSRNMIENILSSIPAHVVIFSIDNYKVRYINSTFQDLFPDLRGRVNDNEELAGQDIFSLIPFNEEARHNIIQALNRQHVTLSLDDRELEENNKFETNFGNMIVEYSLFPIPQYKNSEKLVGLIMNDISEAKHFQQKLLINEKLLALGKVASGIAHEINNPLYAVLANAEEIVDDEENSEESRELADEIVEHVMTVSNVIKDLSAYSKTLRNDDYDDVDLNMVIEESLKLVRYGTNFLGVNVETGLNYLPTIKATKGELQQIFINLFNNGIQAMNGKGTLKVTTNYNGNFITVNVSDSGDGIPKENLSRIFDLFFTTKRKGTGTGQGLHIVNKIVRRYNGTISVDSELGLGTTFTVKFEVK